MDEPFPITSSFSLTCYMTTYANVCLLVVFLFFFNSLFRSIVPARRKVWNVTRFSHRYWMQRTQSAEIFNETTFPAELSSLLAVPASLFADSSSTQTFSTCSGKTFHFMPWRDNLHVVAFVSQRSNIFNNKTNTWFCFAALRAAGKLFLVQQKKRKQKPRGASKANDFCFEKTRECFRSWMHSATVECLLSHFRTWVALKLFILCDARQVPSITRESIYMPEVRRPSMQDECMDLQALRISIQERGRYLVTIKMFDMHHYTTLFISLVFLANMFNHSQEILMYFPSQRPSSYRERVSLSLQSNEGVVQSKGTVSLRS